jgi:hypothetical protein
LQRYSATAAVFAKTLRTVGGIATISCDGGDLCNTPGTDGGLCNVIGAAGGLLAVPKAERSLFRQVPNNKPHHIFGLSQNSKMSARHSQASL